MASEDFYRSALIGGKVPVTDGGGGDESKGYSRTNPSPNFTYTKDPNVNIGKYGIRITKDDMENANKRGMGWNNFDEFSHWFGASHKPVDFEGISPVYRTYPNGQIKGADIAILKAKGDPKIDEILSRNIAKPGEVPLFGPEDSDLLNKLIAEQKNPTIDYMKLVKSK